ncbi:MAG: hypothetical protein NVS2B16_25590 [Chloroflexota bacterium]
MDTKSYLMGVFDGEGCVGTGFSSGRWALQLQVAMAWQPVCELFRQTWGGSCTARSRPTTGGLILWAWIVNSSKAIPFLEYAVEHSLVKRQQCILALELALLINNYSWAKRLIGPGTGGGHRFISDEEMALRANIVREIRSLNGGRSRFTGELPSGPRVRARMGPKAGSPAAFKGGVKAGPRCPATAERDGVIHMCALHLGHKQPNHTTSTPVPGHRVRGSWVMPD